MVKFVCVYIFRANIESKLSDIEQALEYISMNSSRSQTPADDLSRTNTPTPRSSSMTGSCERFPVGTGYKVSDINIEEEKDDSFKFKPNILPSSKSEANITSRERNSRDITLGNRSPREITLGNRSPREVTLGNRSPKEITRQSPGDVLSSVKEKLSRSNVDLESDVYSDKDSYDTRPTSSSSSSRRSRHDENPRNEKQDRKSSKSESSSGHRKTSKNVHFTPTKDLSKNPKRSENQRTSRKEDLQNFDSIHSSDLLPKKYLFPSEPENVTEDTFSAVDPRPNQNNKRQLDEQPPFHTVRTPRDFLSPRETTPSIGHQQSSLYKARSQPELGVGFEQPFSLRESGLGSYKYTSLRDALGKPPNSTSPTKNSSISQEDLRSYPIENTAFKYKKALSVDIGLHNLGLERSPRKFNPSPEKLTHDAGESPMGTPRIRRKIAPWTTDRENNLSSQERIARDFNRYHGGSKPVRNLVEQFSGVV